MQAALATPHAPHAAPLHRRMAPQPPPHRRRLRRLMRTSAPVDAECTGVPSPAHHGHGPRARGRGGAAGAVSNRAHPNAAFKTLRRRALSCRRLQDVDRPVSLARSERLVLPSSSPGRRPVFRANSRRGLRPSSRWPLSGSPRCVRACAQYLTAILRIIPYSAFAQVWRVPPCRRPTVRCPVHRLTSIGDQSCNRRGWRLAATVGGRAGRAAMHPPCQRPHGLRVVHVYEYEYTSRCFYDYVLTISD
jgi:hypothetical protein